MRDGIMLSEEISVEGKCLHSAINEISAFVEHEGGIGLLRTCRVQLLLTEEGVVWNIRRTLRGKKPELLTRPVTISTADLKKDIIDLFNEKW